MKESVMGFNLSDFRHIIMVLILMSDARVRHCWLNVFQLIGIDQPCYVSEHSEVNPKSRIMKLRSRNVCKNAACIFTCH
jgi:hypothetical protein